jgi:hypothetical protein
MAFTSRAPREAGKVDVSTPVNLGPGSYDPSFKHGGLCCKTWEMLNVGNVKNVGNVDP